MKVIIQSISTLFLEIFFPRRCLCCGKVGVFLCLACVGKIETIKTETCYSCGKISVNSQICPACRKASGNYLRSISVVAKYHEGPIKRLVAGLKYEGYREIAEIFGELICERLQRQDFVSKNLVIVPVPLHWRRERGRGFNQAFEIAKYVGEKSGVCVEKLLIRPKKTKAQVGLHRDERLKNIEKAFALQKDADVAGKKILLVDDVATTGATLNECAKVLKLAGAREVRAIVVARNI